MLGWGSVLGTQYQLPRAVDDDSPSVACDPAAVRKIHKGFVDCFAGCAYKLCKFSLGKVMGDQEPFFRRLAETAGL